MEDRYYPGKMKETRNVQKALKIFWNVRGNSKTIKTLQTKRNLAKPKPPRGAGSGHCAPLPETDGTPFEKY